MKRFATFFLYTFIAVTSPAVGEVFTINTNPYAPTMNSGFGGSTFTTPSGVTLTALAGAPNRLNPLAGSRSGVLLESTVVQNSVRVLDGLTPLLAEGDIVVVDGNTYTATNPMTNPEDTEADYNFTNNGHLKATVAGVTYSGDFTGNGTLDVTGGGRPQILFTGDFSGFSGTVMTNQSGWLHFTGDNLGSENAAWIVNMTESDANPSGLLINADRSDKTIKLGKLEGNGCVRTKDAFGGNFTYEVGHLLGENDVSTYTGRIFKWNNDPTATINVNKVGAGKWILTRGDHDIQNVTVKEGTLQFGNGGTTGSLPLNAKVVVEADGAYGYNRGGSGDLGRTETITVKGGTILGMGTQGVRYSNLTFENGGTITYDDTATVRLVVQDLKMTGDAANSRLVIDSTKQRTDLTGSITGGENQEIYYTAPRGTFLNLQNTNLSAFEGTLTAGPGTNNTAGTWIQVNANNDLSKLTFNGDLGKFEGKDVDAGLLLESFPANSTIKIGALAGDATVRAITWYNNLTLEVGGNNRDTTFSGGIQRYNASNFSVVKVGTGTWTITSDEGRKWRAGAAIGDTSVKNDYTGNTTIKEGTLRLGDYDVTTGTGGETGQIGAGASKFVIEEGATLSVARAYTGDEVTINNAVQSNGGTIEVVNPDKMKHVALRGAVTGSIIKTGAGVLAIGADNGANLTQITIKDGYLKNWGTSRLGYGATTIVLDGGTFWQAQDETITNPIRLAEGGGTLYADNDYTYASRFQNQDGLAEGTQTVLTKTGTGTIYLTGTNNAAGSIVVEEGTLQLGKGENGTLDQHTAVTVKEGANFGYNRVADAAQNPVSPENSVTVDGGTLFNAGPRAVDFKNVTFTDKGGTLKNTGETSITANTKNAGNGVITFDGNADGSVVLNVDNSAGPVDFGGLASVGDTKSTINLASSERNNWLKMNGDMSTFRGDINISNDGWFAFNSPEATGSELASWNTNMTNNSGVLFEIGPAGGATYKMGDLTGNGMVRPGNYDQSVESNTITLEVGALSNDSTFSGILSNNQGWGGKWSYLEVVKVGEGTWTLGSAAVNNLDSSANITVKEGTLGLNRSPNVASANNLTVDGGVVNVLEDGQKVTGNVTIKNGTLQVADGKSFAHDNITVNTEAPETVVQMNGQFVGNIDLVNGILSPGTADNQYGNLFVNGDLTLRSGKQLRIDFVDATKRDRMRVSGTVIMQEGSKIALNIDNSGLDLIALDDFFGEVEKFQVGNEEKATEDLTLEDWLSILNTDGVEGMHVAQLGEGEDGKPDFYLATSNAVPEPTTWALMLLGVAGLFVCRRKK